MVSGVVVLAWAVDVFFAASVFVVLAGAAVLEVDGVAHEVGAGDWWLLPAGTAHTIVRTDPGTSWLAVRSTG